MEIQLIRNATLRITYAGKIFLVDPFLAPKFSQPTYAGKSKNPLVDLPIAIDKILDGVDYLIITHTHSDHFDPIARKVAPRNMPIICQKENQNEICELGFENVTALIDSLEFEGMKISYAPGQHGYGAVLKAMGPTMGYVLSSKNEPKVYGAGDTILTEQIKLLVKDEKPDVIVTHSCGAVWNGNSLILMDDKQTIELASIAQKSKIIAVHMESVDHATVTRKMLREAAKANGISANRLIIPNDGDKMLIHA